VRIAMPLPYSETVVEAVDLLPDYRKAGLASVHVAEAYSFDAVSQLGFIAAKLPGLEIASNILPIYTRTPALLAMTAASLDQLSGGRFTLGLGASGPQVIEGFHGVAYDAPLGRTREIIQICRQVWRRERVQHEGRHYRMPLTAAQGGTGLGKPLKLINHPLRERIPILVAAMGPKNVQLAAELADSWAPFFFRPEGADQVWGEALAAGRARRDPALGELDIVVPVPLAIGEDAADLIDTVRPLFALYLGGMGAKGRNFYHDLAARYGYEEAADRVQELYLTGRKDEAAAAVPGELLRSLGLVGPRSWVAERVAALHAAGVSTLSVTPLARTHAERVAAVETLADLLP